MPCRGLCAILTAPMMRLCCSARFSPRDKLGMGTWGGETLCWHVGAWGFGREAWGVALASGACGWDMGLPLHVEPGSWGLGLGASGLALEAGACFADLEAWDLRAWACDWGLPAWHLDVLVLGGLGASGLGTWPWEPHATPSPKP